MEDLLKFRSIITLVGIFLAIFLGLKSWEVWQDLRLPSFDRPTISVQGEGKVFAKPDIGEITLGINSEAQTVEAAQKRATEVINNVFEMLKSKGIEEQDIQTANYSINPIYDYPDGQRRLRLWQVSQSLKVKIRNLEKTGEILSEAARWGANQVGGLTFTTDDPTKLQAEARDQAIEDAKKKAEELASKLGVRLGKIMGFSEFGGPPPIQFFGALGKGGDLGGERIPEIPAGENEIRVNVNITFQLK